MCRFEDCARHWKDAVDADVDLKSMLKEVQALAESETSLLCLKSRCIKVLEGVPAASVPDEPQKTLSDIQVPVVDM